jgi:transglutaminase superfamily protein
MTTVARREWPVNTSKTLWLLLLTSVVSSSAILTKSIGKRHWGMLPYLRRAPRADHLVLVAIAFALLAVACIYLISRMAMVKARVYNSADPSLFAARKLPGSVQQNRNSEALIRFRANLRDVLREQYADSLAEAVAIRQWVRRQQSQDPSMWLTPCLVNHEDPNRLLEEQREGVPGSCRRFSYILLGALLSAGFDARVVGFTNHLFSPGTERRSHVVVEAWIEELSKWILLDPTRDTLVLVDGNVASAFEVHELIVLGQSHRLAFERHRSGLEPHPTLEYYQGCCRNLFVGLSNAIFDGYRVRLIGTRRINFLHYSGITTYPVFSKQMLLGASGCGFFFSLVFWIWALLSLARK